MTTLQRAGLASRRLLGMLATVVLLAAIAGWVAFLRPPVLGGPASLVLVAGPSMQPALGSGDLVLVHAQDVYQHGDVVAFRVPESQPGAGATVIHRIAGGSAATGFIMRGDNRSQPDLWRPGPGDMLGRATVQVPHAGSVLAVLGSPVGVGALAGMLVFVYVLAGRTPPSAPRVVVSGSV